MTNPTPPDEDELKRLRRHVRILLDLGKLAGDAGPVERFLDQVVVQVSRAVEIDHVKVLRYRPSTADFIVAAGVGWKAGFVRQATLSADLRSAPGRAFLTAEPVTIEDFAAQDVYVMSDVLAEHGIVSLSNVPVMIDGAAWGVLEVDSTTPRAFSQDTSDFLSAVGALIGAVLAHQASAADPAAAMAREARDVELNATLLREMQHRVKNNFQLLLASISLSRSSSGEKAVRLALDDVAARIHAISLAHDQLALRPGGGRIVKLADYLRALCASIRRQLEDVEIELDADDLEMAADRAVPIGLVLNEAIANAVKHAFKGGGGRIAVRLTSGIGYGEARLVIRDDGPGMARPAAAGTGLTLIQSLAKQVGGVATVENAERGVAVTLTFPVLT